MIKVNNLLSELFDVSVTDLTDETKLNEIKGWDSIKHMEFILSIEKEFDFELSGEQIASIQTINDIKKIISNDN